MGDSLGQNSQPQTGLKPAVKPAPFPVIGLGASAGGLQALKDFFTHMPTETGMAFVVIMHLSPKHESHVAALLQAALMLAVINRHIGIVKALLSEGADMNAISNDGGTALSLAASGGDSAMKRALLNHRAESAPTSARPAARNGYAGIVRLLQRVVAVK